METLASVDQHLLASRMKTLPNFHHPILLPSLQASTERVSHQVPLLPWTKRSPFGPMTVPASRLSKTKIFTHPLNPQLLTHDLVQRPVPELSETSCRRLRPWALQQHAHKCLHPAPTLGQHPTKLFYIILRHFLFPVSCPASLNRLKLFPVNQPTSLLTRSCWKQSTTQGIGFGY